jgi:hypothetical protein
MNIYYTCKCTYNMHVEVDYDWLLNNKWITSMAQQNRTDL